MTFIEFILLIIFPPLPIVMRYGATKVFWINLLLTIIFYVPGLIHGGYVLLSDTSPRAPLEI